MLYNICYITSNWRLYKQRGFCYGARCLPYNKKLWYTSIAHPNLPDADSGDPSLGQSPCWLLTGATATVKWPGPLVRQGTRCQWLGRLGLWPKTSPGLTQLTRDKARPGPGPALIQPETTRYKARVDSGNPRKGPIQLTGRWLLPKSQPLARPGLTAS